MTHDCIFCKIIAGEIPCHKVYEDRRLLAFLDIAPFSPGHCLLIPKEHFSRLDECSPPVLQQLAQHLPAVAQALVKATQTDGYNVLLNNGRSAGQLVDHVHFHIIPRTPGDGVLSHTPAVPYAVGEAEKLAQKIAALL